MQVKTTTKIELVTYQLPYLLLQQRILYTINPVAKIEKKVVGILKCL